MHQWVLYIILRQVTYAPILKQIKILNVTVMIQGSLSLPTLNNTTHRK